MEGEIAVDGSNVVFWRGGQRDAAMPSLVTRALRARRFVPTVYFDHSIHRHLTQDMLDELSAQTRIVIAPKGTQADALLLEAAVGTSIQIVTNDRFHDWRKTYPQLRTDTLVTGRIVKGGRVQFSKKLRAVPI
ncbi:hypothetical protein ABMC88_16155 [Sulfitobacter sp. HNIBRBA2951]|uniref:NYN domain-containing protein n=1 Tax=Sulfitobacter aquimarinus TaxID=3158557 RepID=UPI0032DFF824